MQRRHSRIKVKARGIMVVGEVDMEEVEGEVVGEVVGEVEVEAAMVRAEGIESTVVLVYPTCTIDVTGFGK